MSDHLLRVDIPGPVVGKGRPRFVRSTGRVFTPGKTLTAENRIGYELARAWGKTPLNEPLTLRVTVFVTVPASHSKKFRAAALAGQVIPAAKPDLDNVIKLIGDAGNKVVWSDDSRLAEIHARRRYAEAPGLSITVERCAGA